MYALTIHQPWASLIAIGRKRFETRDWHPPKWLIGQRIAIHAAKKPVSAPDLRWAELLGFSELPLGAVVGTAVVAGVYQCGVFYNAGTHQGHAILEALEGSVSLPEGYIPHDPFGDYSVGRWAWLLTEVEPLEPPVEVRGSQGLWKWEYKDDQRGSDQGAGRRDGDDAGRGATLADGDV